MTWRTDLAALVDTFDDATAARTETYTVAAPYVYKLASTVSGGDAAIPAAWQAIPHGAPAVPSPAAIATFTDRTTTRGLLEPAGGGYLYILSYLTQYGETLALNTAAHTLGARKNAVEIAIPNYPNSVYNPITGVMIYRSKIGPTVPLYPIGQIFNARITGFLDELGDDQMQTTTGVPVSDTSGLNVLGSPNLPVSVVGPLAAGGSGQWTEVPYGTTLSTEHYSVDYLSDPNGGNVYFSSADNTKVVTITYTAAIDITAPFINSLISPLRTLGALTLASVNSADGNYHLGVSGGSWTIDTQATRSVTTQGGTRLHITLNFDAAETSGSPGAFIAADIFLNGVAVQTGHHPGDASVFNGLLYPPLVTYPENTTTPLTCTVTTGILAAGAQTIDLGIICLNGGVYDLSAYSWNITEIL